MKIVKKSLKRLQVGFPTKYEGLTKDGVKVDLEFRYGNLKISVDDEVLVNEPKDEFSLEGIIGESELLDMLARLNWLETEDGE